MTFDLAEIMESKRRHRARMAALPIAEKLQMLDALRERAVTIRTASPLKSRSADKTPTKENAVEQGDGL